MGKLFEISSYFWNLARHIVWIFEKDSPIPRGDLLLNYLQLEFTYLFFERLLRKKQKKVQILGFLMDCSDMNTVVRLYEEIFIHNIYYFKTTRKSPFILDCGGHIGMSVMFFKIIYPNSKIVVFEPEKYTFEILRKNVAQNKFSNVTLHNKAVFGRSGFLTLYFKKDNPACGTGGVYPLQGYEPEKVPSVVLSSFVGGRVDFAKIDIEGSEMDVFEQLAKSKKIRQVRETCIEYHHHLKPNEDKLSKMLSILEQNNFGYLINSYFPSNTSTVKMQGMIIYAYQKP